VLEVFPGGGAVAAARLSPSGGPVRITVNGRGDGAVLRRLTVHGMPRATA
jgi:hypothetical protein